MDILLRPIQFRRPLGYILLTIIIATMLVTIEGFYRYQLIMGDEIWAATNANGNLLTSLAFTLRWDVHPPVYYLFVTLWAFFSKSDAWLLASSAFTHAATVVLVLIYVEKRLNLLSKVLLAVLVLVCPILFDYSDSLRMYSLISMLSVGLLLVCDRFIQTQDFQKKHLFYYFVIACLLSYSHVLGILFVFFHFLFVSVSLLEKRALAKAFKWCIFNGCIASLAAPALLNSFVRSVAHASAPSLKHTLHSVGLLFFGNTVSTFVGASVIFALIILSCLASKTRKLCIIYVISPFILCALISHFVKPVWLDRNFVFMAPIALITFVLAVQYQKRITTQFALVAMLLFTLINSGFNAGRLLQYAKQAPSALTEQAHNYLIGLKDTGPICIMTQSELVMFWQVSRYVLGPNWGDPMSAQPKPNEKWAALLNKVPDSINHYLKFRGEPNYFTKDGITLSSGFSDVCYKTSDTAILMAETGLAEQFDIPQESILFKNARYEIIEVKQQVAKTVLGVN